LSGEVADQTILDMLSRIFPQAALVHAFASTEAGLAFEVTDRRAGFPPSLMDFSGDGPELRVVEGMLQVCSERGAKGILDGIVVPIAGPDGFIDTGDAVAWQDERFVFAGRRDGIVNVGGQKVFPEEVEAVINQHPAVRMSRVSARRNAITGAVVSAEIVQRDGGAPVAPIGLPEDVIRFCRERLPAHKVPVSIRLVPSLEVAPSGKLVRLRA
jgi:acyl-CoA synthetase (AMP-forming)/AMP-acid ligase II